MLKIAEISQVDYENGMVKVRIPDRDNVETNWLAMQGYEYEMPKVNDIVRVDLDDDDYTNGICQGRYYNRKYPPVEHGETLFYKRLLGDMVIVYEGETKMLEITATDLVVHGDVTIHGKLTVIGGDVVADGISLKHHTHPGVMEGGGSTGQPK